MHNYKQAKCFQFPSVSDTYEGQSGKHNVYNKLLCSQESGFCRKHDSVKSNLLAEVSIQGVWEKSYLYRLYNAL